MGGTEMDFDLLPIWALDEYRRRRAGLIDVKQFGAMAVDGESLITYDRRCFERDIVLVAVKRRSLLLSRWCVGIHMSNRFPYIPFDRFKQVLFYSHRNLDAIDGNMGVTKGDPELHCSFLDKPCTNMYAMRGETHRTKALEFEIRQRTEVRNQIFVGWHDFEMFAVSQ